MVLFVLSSGNLTLNWFRNWRWIWAVVCVSLYWLVDSSMYIFSRKFILVTVFLKLFKRNPWFCQIGIMSNNNFLSNVWKFHNFVLIYGISYDQARRDPTLSWHLRFYRHHQQSCSRLNAGLISSVLLPLCLPPPHRGPEQPKM